MKKTVIASIPVQGSFQNGSEMCTICSSMLCMAIASNLFPDPKTCSSRQLLENMLSYIMHHASMLQTKWMLEDSEYNTSGSSARRQVMEVVEFIQGNDTRNLWKTGCLTECFGTIGPPSANEEGALLPVEESNTQMDRIVVSGLEDLLHTHMQKEDTLAVTFAMHTVCLYKKCESEWYVFDSLTGEMTCVEWDAQEETQEETQITGQRFPTGVLDVLWPHLRSNLARNTSNQSIFAEMQRLTYSGIICRKAALQED